jgi:hypothetical protein
MARRTVGGSDGGPSRGRPFGVMACCSQPFDFGFEGVEAFGLFGDEDVGVEQLADELDEELE